VNLSVGAGARGALACEREGLDGMTDREVLPGEEVAQRGGGPERRGPRRELDGARVVSGLRGRRGVGDEGAPRGVGAILRGGRSGPREGDAYDEALGEGGDAHRLASSDGIASRR
jgi:hypothetical protein